MSAYSELVKNFEKIRAYMREFLVYGFRRRGEFGERSARSYDDERRRIESWLGDHMRFVRTPEGKSLFISIDSRVSSRNPLYRAWKAKSFTDRDITLHFILFDILHSPEVRLSVSELLARIDSDYLAGFSEPMSLDESTLRKKLAEYVREGILETERDGRRILYRRADSPALPASSELLDFYSEVAPCGVIGSFLLDKRGRETSCVTFKHHYIASALDGDILALLFCAMREGRSVTLAALSRGQAEASPLEVIPLRIFISTASGRQHLLAYEAARNRFLSFRVDYITSVTAREISPRFGELRAELDRMQEHMWGVSPGLAARFGNALERVSFTLRVGEGEEHAARRLMREKRIGRVEQLDPHTYRFTAEVVDANEMIPWLRSFLGRIESISFSNPRLEKRFRRDIEAMYRLYGVGEVSE